MHFGFHSSEKAAAILTNPRAFPERLMLAACVVLLALIIFLAQGFDAALEPVGFRFNSLPKKRLTGRYDFVTFLR